MGAGALLQNLNGRRRLSDGVKRDDVHLVLENLCYHYPLPTGHYAHFPQCLSGGQNNIANLLFAVPLRKQWNKYAWTQLN